jgi:hypothetical protein
MANWDKLNKEFNNLLESFQDSDWSKWKSNRALKKETRRLKMIKKTKIFKENLKD